VGSIWGGFKTTTAKNQLPLEIDVRELKLDARFVDEINSRLILIYTGITRLAKDLLLNVLRNWYAISKEIYDNVQELVKNGSRCSRALENGSINQIKSSVVIVSKIRN
jgi:fucokinase